MLTGPLLEPSLEPQQSSSVSHSGNDWSVSTTSQLSDTETLRRQTEQSL